MNPRSNSQHSLLLQGVSFPAILLLTPLAATAADAIEIVPTYECASVHVPHDNPADRCELWFRQQGSADWRPAYPPVYAPQYPRTEATRRLWEQGGEVLSRREFRGSIVRLTEDAAYEVRAVLRAAENGQVIREETTAFRTLSSRVPVARTLRTSDLLKNPAPGGGLVLDLKGTPAGWIEIVGDAPLVVPEASANGPRPPDAAVHLKGARHVILRDVVIKGGARHGILVEDCQDVHILNVGISGFGRPGTQDFNQDGSYYVPGDRNPVNHDAGICILQSGRLLVERCWIHDPRIKANSWRYSHPKGPNAVFVQLPSGQVVLRHNDFIGGDVLRWNDTIEGFNNQSPQGSFFRDSDIQGNMFAFANDDGIELDGGQMNLRVFDNRFEQGLMAVSTDPCVLGPSYIFHNLVHHLGDEDQRAAYAIKNSGPDRVNALGRAHYFHNTFHVRAGGTRFFNGVSRNNIYSCFGTLAPLSGIGDLTTFHHDFDHDLLDGPSLTRYRESLAAAGLQPNGVFGKPRFANSEAGDFRLRPDSPGRNTGQALPNFSPESTAKPHLGVFQESDTDFFPRRPVPLRADATLLHLEGSLDAAATPAFLHVRCDSLENTGGAFRILRSEDCPWLSVTPETGGLQAGATVRFTVTTDPRQLQERSGTRHAVFLVKLRSGYSLPVSVIARIRNPGVAILAEAESLLPDAAIEEDREASGGKAVRFGAESAGPLEFTFDIPKEGCYHLMARVRELRGAAGMLRYIWQLNDGERQTQAFRPPNKVYGWDRVPGFERQHLPVGRHLVRLFPGSPVVLDRLALVSEPYPEVWETAPRR